MPPTTKLVSGYVKDRWAAYLAFLMNENPSVTRSQIATALELPVSRVSAWLSADRLVRAETAFDICERLTDQLAWRTSGPEGLYACGYAAELLDFLKHLSADRAANGHALAVAYYCWLPYRFAGFEKHIADNLSCERMAHGATIYQRELDALSLDKHGGRYIDSANSIRERSKAFEGRLREEAARVTVLRAWTHLRAGRVRPTFEPHAPFASISDAPSQLDVIEALTAVAHKMRSVEPTCALPRLWRMLAEWAYYVDPGTFSSELILDTFVPVFERERREADEEYYVDVMAAECQM